MNNTVGIYIHVPFCAGKCSYCNFYSSAQDFALMDDYCNQVIKQIGFFGKDEKRAVDTVYFGGGTPSLLGGDRLCRILGAVKAAFNLLPNAEITLEANPADNLLGTFAAVKQQGVNRISLGVQTAVEKELVALSRRHTNQNVINAARDAKSVGIDNISLDLMLGIPHQTQESLKESVEFLMSLGPKHVSAYILKVEPTTELFTKKHFVVDDDLSADLYLEAVRLLKNNGFKQYEVSNFCLEGYKSRHNLRYWTLSDYIGIGPSAHSFYKSKRFLCPPDLRQFLRSPQYVFDCNGSGIDEYVMLSLRTSDGINFNKMHDSYNADLKKLTPVLDKLQKANLGEYLPNGFRLNEKGFLLSNSVIVEVLSALEE